VVAGTVVAFSEERAEPESCGHYMTVRSLRTAAVVHRFPLACGSAVLGAALKPDGSVAWLQRYDNCDPHGSCPGPLFAAYTVDRAGFRDLTGETFEELTGLTIAGSVVSWSENGQRTSAALR
jgi:hypothetical protein